MPSFTSLAIPALYQTSRQFAPRSMAALRQAQYSSKTTKPDVVTFEEIDTLIHKKDKVLLFSFASPLLRACMWLLAVF